MTTIAQAKQQLAEAQKRFERIQSRGPRERQAELDAKAGTCMDCGRSLSREQGGRSKIRRNGRLEIRW